MADDDNLKHRKIYSRGYYDALTAVGIDTTGLKVGDYEMLKQAKLDMFLGNANSATRKIYDLVPCNKAVTLDTIYAYSQRKGYTMDKKIVGGCLNGLCDDKIIKETRLGWFIRAPIKPTLVNIKKEAPVVHHTPSQKTPQQSAAVDLLDVVSDVEALGKAMEILADNLTKISLRIEVEKDTESEELKKFQQLKSLLSD